MTRLSVGQREAMDALITMSFDRLDQLESSTAGRRLRHAINRAERRYRQVRDHYSRGFYHGLIAGYAVALKGSRAR